MKSTLPIIIFFLLLCITNESKSLENRITFNEFMRFQYFDAKNSIEINKFAISALSLPTHIGALEIQYGDGSWIERNVKIVQNPTNKSDNALQFTINESNCCDDKLGRIQLNAYRLEHLKTLNFSVDMFIPENQKHIISFPGEMNFLTISEWWNNEGWGNSFPFRVSINLVKKQA